MPKKKALLVFPIFQALYPRPFRSFAEVLLVAGRLCPEWDFGVIAPERQNLVSAMTQAAQAVVQQQYDAMVVFDDDCFPPYDCIPRLLKHVEQGRLFVAGLGLMRSFPHTTTAAQVFAKHTILHVNGEGRVTRHQWLDDLDLAAGLKEVDFCGVPVAVIAREAFERTQTPWFGLHGEDGGQVTHDVFFCRRLQAAGIPVLVDTTLKCGHLAEAPIVTFENRDQVRELVAG